MGQVRPNALLVFAVSPVQQTRIVEFAAKNRLPALYGFREAADAGGLMSFGPKFLDLWRGAANYVDKILKGGQAWRPTRRTAHEVRAGRQPEGRQDARPDDSSVAPPAGGSGD